MAGELKCLDAYFTINKWTRGYFLLLVFYPTSQIKMIHNSSDSKRNNSPSILIPLFSNLISGGGDFLAEGSFLGTSKCEGMLLLLLLWLGGRGLAWLPNSCFTTTGGNTVLLVITFFDVEGTADGVLPKKTDANFFYNSRKSRFCFYAHRGIPLLSLKIPFSACCNITHKVAHFCFSNYFPYPGISKFIYILNFCAKNLPLSHFEF